MRAPAKTIDEDDRIKALHDLEILDTRPEVDFDSIVEFGRLWFKVPICLVSLIDSDRQWFKAKAGLDADETPRDLSFCGHAIHGTEVFVIPNATEDDRFNDNPLVTGPPDIRFYAGAPIKLDNGRIIGTVCIISPEPRYDFDEEARSRLASLARLTVDMLARRSLRRDISNDDRLRARYQTVLEMVPGPLAMLSPTGDVDECNAAFEALCRIAPIGRPVAEALGIDPTQWTPENATPEGSLVRVFSGSDLLVRATPAGLVVSAPPAKD